MIGYDVPGSSLVTAFASKRSFSRVYQSEVNRSTRLKSSSGLPKTVSSEQSRKLILLGHSGLDTDNDEFLALVRAKFPEFFQSFDVISPRLFYLKRR